MSRRNLTSKQHSFLEYLQGHLHERRVWPTYREIVEHFQYRSPNSVTQNLQALSKKGFLRRDHAGYQLVEQSAGEAAIPVRGAVRGGHIEPGAAERLTLATLLPELRGLYALRLDAAAGRPAELADASYVLLGGDAVLEGETAVALYPGGLTLRRVGPAGRLEHLDGLLSPLHPTEAEVLGRYAGHVGPYGLVRAARSAPSAPAVAVEAIPEVSGDVEMRISA